MNMKKFCALMMIAIMLFAFSVCAYAQDAGAQEAPVSSAEEISKTESSSDGSVSSKAWAAAIAIGVAAAAGAISMGNAISKSVEGISRQPEAEGKIRTSLMLGLVFVETAIIYALIVAILIVFVL